MSWWAKKIKNQITAIPNDTIIPINQGSTLGNIKQYTDDVRPTSPPPAPQVRIIKEGQKIGKPTPPYSRIVAEWSREGIPFAKPGITSDDHKDPPGTKYPHTISKTPMLHGTEVDVGDVVYHPCYGKGVIIEIDMSVYRSIKASFDNYWVYSLPNGKIHQGDAAPSLYLHPIQIVPQ